MGKWWQGAAGCVTTTGAFRTTLYRVATIHQVQARVRVTRFHQGAINDMLQVHQAAGSDRPHIGGRGAVALQFGTQCFQVCAL